MASFDKISKTWKGPQEPSCFPNDAHISEIILKSLKETPDRILQIFDENGAQLTCDELRVKAIRVAQNLARLGIKSGDVVGFNCTNSENICALIHGCIFSGAVLSPMSVLHANNDLLHMWRQTEPKLIFCDAEVYEKVVEVTRCMENNVTLCTLIERVDGVMFVDEILAATGIENSFEAVKFNGNSLICLSSSSGTTGPAKAVCVTQNYMLQVAPLFEIGELRFISFGQIFWLFTLSLFITLPLTKLVRIVTRRLPSVENYFEYIEKFKLDYLFIDPMMLTQFLQSTLIKKTDLSSLKIVCSAGGICHPDVRIKFEETFPDKHLISCYASTEMCFVWPSLSHRYKGYEVGHQLANTEIKVIDDDGNNLGVNETGEIRGKRNFPFSGYYKNPEATMSAIDDDQFFKTGDVGYIDHCGILNVVDRKKDIFKYGLHHINPAEIENIILSLDGVEQVVVVGIPNGGTHLTCAIVKKHKGYEQLIEEDIVAYVAEQLPKYKQLHGGVYFVDRFPTTPNGKILKRLLVPLVEEEYRKQTSN